MILRRRMKETECNSLIPFETSEGSGGRWGGRICGCRPEANDSKKIDEVKSHRLINEMQGGQQMR